MEPIILIITVAGSYLLGAVSFSRIAQKMLSPDEDMQDVEVHVTGSDQTWTHSSTGASTLGMRHGNRVGCVVGLLDMAKIFIPTLALRFLYPDQPYFLIAATVGMVGHIWPVYYRFKGGRGVSSVYGGLMAIDPIGAIVTSMAGLLAGIFIFRDFMIAYLSGMWLIIPWLWFTTQNVNFLLYGFAVNVLFIIAMIPDLKAVYRYRNLGSKNLRESMEAWPMGRGLIKMFERMGITIK